jgi:hypothetical protein
MWPHRTSDRDVYPDDLALFGLRGQLDQVIADFRGDLWGQVGVLHAP